MGDPENPTGPTSEKDSPPAETKETPITKADLEKAVSDAKAAAGREWKKKMDTLEQEREKAVVQAKSDVSAAQSKVDELQDKIDELELSDREKDPEATKLLALRKGLKAAQRQLDEDKATLAKERDKVNADKAEVHKERVHSAMIDAAVEAHVSIEDLEARLEELGITDPARFPSVAKLLTPKETITPDSGQSSGGTNDKQFLKDYAAGKSNDHARALKLSVIRR